MNGWLALFAVLAYTVIVVGLYWLAAMLLHLTTGLGIWESLGLILATIITLWLGTGLGGRNK